MLFFEIKTFLTEVWLNESLSHWGICGYVWLTGMYYSLMWYIWIGPQCVTSLQQGLFYVIVTIGSLNCFFLSCMFRLCFIWGSTSWARSCMTSSSNTSFTVGRMRWVLSWGWKASQSKSPGAYSYSRSNMFFTSYSRSIGNCRNSCTTKAPWDLRVGL